MGKIVTFYSYKGGTGRSMALANVAWVLASDARRVLVVDWDLEAPGLHRYFRPFLLDPDLTAPDSSGVIDFIVDFAVQVATPSESHEGWHRRYADVSKWAKPLLWPSGEPAKLPLGGSVDFIPAGRQGPQYAQRVNSFDWTGFYERLNGGAFIDAVRQSMSSYDYVLIDSRTGVSDTAGICTTHLPDILVICFTLNQQSVLGASAVAASVKKIRKELGRDIQILPVQTRIDGSEEKLLNRMKAYARRTFDPLLDASIDKERYWYEMSMPYFARYAYSEKLAPFEDQTDLNTSMLPSIERLTERITGGAVTKLRALPDEERVQALRVFESLPGDDRVPRPEVELRSLFKRVWLDLWRQVYRWLTLPSTFKYITALAFAATLAKYSGRDILQILRPPARGAGMEVLITAAAADIRNRSMMGWREHAALLTAEAAATLAPGERLTPGSSVLTTLMSLAPLRLGHVEHKGSVNVVRFSPDGNLVATAAADGTSQAFSTLGGAAISWSVPNSGWALAFSPDGVYLATGTKDGQAIVYDRKSLREVTRVPAAGSVDSAVFSPDSRLLAVGTDKGHIVVSGIDPWRRLADLAESGGILSLNFSPDSQYVGAGTMYHIVWDQQKATFQTFWRHTGPVRMIAFAPGRKLRWATASADGTVGVWTEIDGKDSRTRVASPFAPDSTILPVGADVYAVAFSPDGRLLATGSGNNSAQLWSVQDGKLISTLRHGADVRSVSFSSDGKWLATGSGDGTARVWDVASGKELQRIVFRREVNSVVFSSDARYLAAGSTDRTAAAWLVTPSPAALTMTAAEARALACLQTGGAVLGEVERQQYFGAGPHTSACGAGSSAAGGPR